MQATKDNRLGTENITRLMISLAIPSVLAQIVNVLYNIVDRIYIGRIPGVGLWPSPAWASPSRSSRSFPPFPASQAAGVLLWRPLHWDREIGNGQKGSWETVFLCFCSLP